MALHASPGVYFETLDLSLYAPQLSQTILALVGKTAKGSSEPTYITSVRDFIDTYGVPRKTDFSAYAALSYLEYGSSLWFKRLVGNNAKAASAEIPKAEMVNDELLSIVDNTNQYIFSGTLQQEPVPGTIEVKIVNPDNEDSFTLITDSNLNNGSGTFSPSINTSITDYPNFIDYDTGEYRFTISNEALSALSPDTSKTVSLRYNQRVYKITNESAKTIVAVDENKSYEGLLKYSNIVPDSSFMINVSTTNDMYTFKVGPETAESGVYKLIGTNSSGSSVSSDATDGCTLNVKTGHWRITLLSSVDNLVVGDVILASYQYNSFKTRQLGVIGEANPDGGTYGRAYIGSLNNVIFPESVYVVVTEVNDSAAVSETDFAIDNGTGKFVTTEAFSTKYPNVDAIQPCDNSVNYAKKTLNFGLITPPNENYKVVVSYMAKYSQLLYTATTSSSGETITSTMVIHPIVKNSLTISIKDTNHTLTDDGEGNIIVASSVDDEGNNDGLLAANGTIDYDTGAITITYLFSLDEGDEIRASYLSKYADVTAKAVGAYFDQTKMQFYKDKFIGYGLKIWSPEQYTTQTPYEDWKDITFDDSSLKTYITNKVISELIDITLADETGTAYPVFNTIVTLTGGDDDEENITSGSAILAINEFGNYETYDVNLIACSDFPGDKSVAAALLTLCETTRGDCFALIDPPSGLTPQRVVEWANGDGMYANENSLNSSFGALYYPWIQILDPFTESLQWVPPSVKIVGVYAYNDSVADVWNAPAGLNRGKINSAQKLERILTVGERDLLYATDSNAINPICDFVSDGIVVYGQKTLQRKPSALDRVNVARLLIYVAKILATAFKYLLFEPNDEQLWLQYIQIAEPYLNEIKARRGLYEFKVVCDSSTNTAYYIDNNTLVAEIWMKPTKTAERIITRFVITSTGASFDELSTSSSSES